jgi:tetratricopeptide (TPR) repeat protein
MIQKTPNDPFLHYAQALELKKLDQLESALQSLAQTIRLDAHYCYAYYQQGQILEQLQRPSDAKDAYRNGLDAAHRAGDAKAAGELEAALDMVS